MKQAQRWLNLPLGDHPIESGKPKLRIFFKIIHAIPFSAVKLSFGVTCPNLLHSLSRLKRRPIVAPTVILKSL